MSSLKVKFRKSKIFPMLNQWWIRHVYKKWNSQGCPLPPPHEVKQKMIYDFLEKYPSNVFIETGTYTGKMILAMLRAFNKIVSIELDATLAAKAQQNFSDQKHVTIYQGDSGMLMKDILNDINERCIFWLDGHYSGGVTAAGDSYTPVLEELDMIFGHQIKDHVILIDDVHCFIDDDAYPDITEIEALIAKNLPGSSVDILSNIICIHPQSL